MRLCKIFVLILLLFVGKGTIFAFEPKNDSDKFSLTVTLKDNNDVLLQSVLVQLMPYELWGMTDDKGIAEIKDIPFDEAVSYQLVISSLGYKTKTVDLKPKAGDDLHLSYTIEEESISLGEVVVVAENRKSGESTASKIGRQAIDHLQATSLKDLMQLIPGQVSMTNPNLCVADYFNIRSLDVGNVNSFGSGIMMDGVPISTNADMGASLDPLSRKDKGVDLRSIGTDNIESVEIIRGIASAEYGDVSSGMMIVNNKVGVTDFNIKAKIMPGITQVYAGKGFKTGRFGNINISADYAHGKSDPRYMTDSYDRYLATVGHSVNVWHGNWSLTTNLNFSGVNEWSGADPDEPELLQKYYQERRDFKFSVSHNGKINLNKLFARTLKYDLSFSYNNDYYKEFKLQPVGGGAILDATTENGPIIGNNGFLGMYEGVPYPATYETVTGTKSIPINWFAKISDKFQLNAGKFLNHFNIGFEFRADGNEGFGRFDESKEYPSIAQARERRFSDTPYLMQISAYAEDNFNLAFSEKPYPNINGQIGVRWTMIQPGREECKNSVTPRINVSFNFLKWLSIHFGYGISDKMPSLMMLYPDEDYFDYYNMTVNNGNNRYYLYSTRINDPVNINLEPMRNTKWEAGIDLKFDNGMSFSVIGYHENIKNAFAYDNSEWLTYRLPKWTPDDIKFEGSKPVYDINHPSLVENVLINVVRPSNKGHQRNYGIEYDFNFGKIKATRTSFYLSGAYNCSEYVESTKLYRSPVGENRTYSDIYLVYPEGSSSKSKRSEFSSALRVVQHIPAINFIVSATAQFVFFESQQDYNVSHRPIGYISTDGKFNSENIGGTQYIPFTQEQLDDPDYRFADGRFMLKDQTYNRSISDEATVWPFIWCLNLRVTKEIGKHIGFSFYANNMLFHQPWQSNSTSTNVSERNRSLFSYGLELFFKF